MSASGSVCCPMCKSAKSIPAMNSFIVPLQQHWLSCQCCTLCSGGSHTGFYWHWGMEQKQQAFALWPVICTRCLPFVYFTGSTVLLYFILLSRFMLSTVILCSSTRLFSSLVPMLPVVHHTLGAAPKQAESQCRCRCSSESQSHLNLSTSPPCSFVLCLSSLLQLNFFLFSLSPSPSPLLFCLSPYLSRRPFPGCLGPNSLFLNKSDTQFDFTFSHFSDLQSQCQPPDYTAIGELKHHLQPLLQQTLNKPQNTADWL